ncbi:GPO family capsid scaffolding protein [Pseudomonas qingdaonensis]|uniref:GPO family capsid scaffolding protein n=1 Tax=Pseudomonas qingdaonensis TaxID=2056231 RepID=UPI000C28567E|nr:GPO family capsid scaffolding protein [Pseudomonas qingdaonensis]
MPRSLVSFWKRVATSGPTVDGREILPQELRDIAETYKPSYYTAPIWYEHERDFGSYGTVYAIRLVEDGDDLEPGQVALEAQLKPNDKLLHLNDMGEKLFTSIEIRPNFANSGRAYLGGLAVTDEPASLGTQELYFKCLDTHGSKAYRSKVSRSSGHLSAGIELDLDGKPSETEAKTLIGLMTRFFTRFAADEQEAEPSTDTPTESKTPMDEATGTGLKALRDQLVIIVAGLDVLIDGAAADAPEPDESLVESTQEAVDEIVETAENERAFKRQAKGNKAVLAGIARMEKMFSHLQNTPQGRQLKSTTGSRSEKRRVV